ncbi:MAG: PAS domain-containing protein [Gammaproteobacteria bacterium]|nr:MAG: PAS domain-containing protein [Gammaproteobacteria bacterium]
MKNNTKSFSNFALDFISTKILIANKKLQIIYLNKAAEDFLNTTFEDAENKNISKIFFEKPKNDLELKELFENKSHLKRHITTLFLNNDLKKKTSFLATYFEDEKKDEFIVFEFFSADKTSIESKRERQFKGDVITNAFSKVLAHEIKNPLSGIKGSAQLLMNKVDDPENQEFLNIILKETDRITKIIDQVSKKNFQLNQKPFNVHSILEKIPNFVDSLNLADISVQRDYDPSIPLLNVDDNLLGQVFYNLARNSVEAIDSSKKGNKIILRTRIIYETFINKTFHKSACLIEISDNGPGIPDDLIDSIFFPLVSTKEITSGLGLAIARGIINQHKGEIDCLSNSKETTFSVILPIEENSEFAKEELNA